MRTKRRGTEFQDMLAESVPGHDYFSDDYQGYKTVLYWPALHYPMTDKSETYSVEGANADLRHYLARLRRKSRCFSRCPYALICALRLFIYAFNGRQLYKQKYPQYPAHVKDFLTHKY